MEIKIPSLELKEEIGRGGQSIVFRALRNGRQYAVKVFSEDPSRNKNAEKRFLREAEALGRIKHTGTPRVMEVGQVENRPYVVIEYIEGRTLAEELRAGSIGESRLLEIARVLAEALNEIHSINLIHHDIKPANIVIDQNEKVRLIDFGLAAYKPKSEMSGAIGTLIYASPEQTGMIKRPVDTRSDLYSLGVVLFECATGKPPFYATDPNELIRLHISQKAPEVSSISTTASPALSKIIAKLLNKDPDDRYQSSAGLLKDLNEIISLNNTINEGGEAVFDSYDIYGTEYSGETELVGREVEINAIEANLEKARHGHGKVVLIEGQTGSGKSRLCFEFINKMLRSDFLVLKGKATELDIQPFTTIKSLIEEYGSFLRKLSPQEKKTKEDGLVNIVGSYAPILKNLSPLFSRLFAGIEEVPAENAQDLLYDGLVCFLQGLSSSYKTLIIFADDIQWMDENSREVFKRLISSTRDLPILILAAGRSDAKNKPKIEEFSSFCGDRLSSRIIIENLSKEMIQGLLCAYLQTTSLDNKFVEAIMIRSEGNPFAAVEYLRSMLDAGLLRPCWGKWEIDLVGLDSLHLPSDIIELVLRRISDLGASAKKILTKCAVIGAEFGVEHLETLCETNIEEIYSAIVEAYKSHIIERIGAKYRFVHDRVHEALLSELSETEFKDLNQKIARALDAIGGEGREYCYSLAKHYSLGLCEDNPLRVYETNFKAGILALENYTPNDAYIFFKTADKYASTQEFLFKKNFGIACFQICRMEEALKHFNFALGLTADKLDQVDIRIYLAASNMSDIRTKEALEELKIGFKTVGKPVPEANFFSIFSSLWLFLIWGVLDRFNLMYGSSKGSQSKERLIELKLLDWLSRVQFFILNPIIMLQINFRMLFLAHLVGDSRNTANIYGTFGALVLAGMRKEKAARKMLKKAAAVAYRIADPQAIDRINSGFGTLEYYLGHEREAIIKYRECYKNHLRWLDEQDFNGFHFMFFWELFNNGLIHEALDVIKSYTAALEQKTSQVSSAETRFIMSWLSLSQAYLYLGKTEEAVENFNKAHNVIKKMGWDFSSALSRAAWVFFSLPFLVEKEEIGPQFDDILEVFYKLKLPKSMLENALRTVFVNKCYGRLIQCRASSKPDLKPLEEALKELKSVAKSFKPNFANQHTIEAGLNNLKGQHKKALALLYKAEEIAADIDWPQVHIDIEREKARTYIALGNTPAGVRSAMTALDIAARYDWEHKINQIQKEFGLKTASSGTSFDHITSTSQDTSKFIDSSSLRLKRYLDALLKVSLAASAILNPDQQIRSALDEIVRILGAENAYLFLCKKEDCQEIELKAGRDAQQNDLSLKYASFNNKVLDEVVKTEKAVVLSDKESGSILAAPLIMRDNLIGVMYLSNQLAKDVFTREDVDILLAVSNHIAIALDSAKTIQSELERKSLEKVNLLLGEKVKEKTEELKKTYERLAHSEKLAALGKLGGAISHEVRTPLAIIKNSAELLSDLVPQKSPDTIRCLEHINNESEKAMLIISDILNFLRIKMPELKTINVEDVIAESVSAISHPRTVKLEMSISRDLPSILADPTQLGQVFNNLIQNAYQAMPKGGTLKIDASRIGDRIQIRFIDSGEGIPEKNLSKIFEMLFTTKQQGTGFGLAICKTIIEGLNGEIAVESTVGKGTTFTVSLPAATRPEA